MFVPQIKGVVATDLSGRYIAGKLDGKLVTVPKLVGRHIQELDRHILMNSIDSTDLLVMGENTYKQMKGLLTPKQNVLVSRENAVYLTQGTLTHIVEETQLGDLFDKFNATVPTKSTVKRVLPTLANLVAMKHQRNINVLGGASVYESFGSRYTSFTVSTLKTLDLSGVEGAKGVNEMPDLFYQRREVLVDVPEYMAVTYFRHKEIDDD